jgi:hypothetical protein
MSTNLPPQTNTDSATKVKVFFDNYFNKQISYPAEQIDSVVDYFTKRGFDQVASTAVSTVLLQQAYVDQINVYTLLDTLKGLTEVQISAVVAEILNTNRQKTSVLGYRQQSTGEYLEARNVVI